MNRENDYNNKMKEIKRNWDLLNGPKALIKQENIKFKNKKLRIKIFEKNDVYRSDEWWRWLGLGWCMAKT